MGSFFFYKTTSDLDFLPAKKKKSNMHTRNVLTNKCFREG